MFQVKVEFGASMFVSDRVFGADPTSCNASGLVQRSLMKCCWSQIAFWVFLQLHTGISPAALLLGAMMSTGGRKKRRKPWYLMTTYSSFGLSGVILHVASSLRGNCALACGFWAILNPENLLRGALTLAKAFDICTFKMPTLDKTLLQEWPPMAHL